MARYRATKTLPEGRALIPSDFDVDAFCDDNDRLFEEHEACGGDFIWAADAFWGIQWIECLCGLPMFCQRGKVIATAGPKKWLIENLDNLKKLKIGNYFDKSCTRTFPARPPLIPLDAILLTE